MHICPDDVAPLVSVLEFIPHYARWAWTKLCLLCSILQKGSL